MAIFSVLSLKNLMACDLRLQNIMSEAIKYFDFRVTCGHRTKEEQDTAFALGSSKVQYPNSKHNAEPSLAVDIVPWPVDWHNKESFYYLAGVVMTIAAQKGIRLRFGGDWNRNHDFKDETFFDLGHYELEDKTHEN